LSPALAWDGQNAAREVGEWLIGLIEEAARLEPPHEFPEPRRTTVAARPFEVRGLRDAAAQLRDGRFGRWTFAMARRPEDVRGLLDRP
jgi:adenine-specific DNA-methyltransferase